VTQAPEMQLLRLCQLALFMVKICRPASEPGECWSAPHDAAALPVGEQSGQDAGAAIPASCLVLRTSTAFAQRSILSLACISAPCPWHSQES